MVIHAVQVPHCPLPDDIEVIMFPNVSNVCGLICTMAPFRPPDANANLLENTRHLQDVHIHTPFAWWWREKTHR